MRRTVDSSRFITLGVTAMIAAIAISPRSAQSQQATPPPLTARDSVVIAAGPDYAAGGLRRKLLGGNYRDLWTAPIKVPVLDLSTFAGGIKPFKTGGGKQGKSLRFVTADSTEWVFRPVHKTFLVIGEEYDNTIVWTIFHDQGSASHPAGAFAAAPMLTAAGVLHPSPRLAVMPDDPLLGDFRKEFAGVLGMIEEYPTKPKDAPGFAGAEKVIETDELLEGINKDPQFQVDAREFLTARLMDLLLGDNDRHPNQWKWAQLGKSKDELWVPIPRDRDKVFVSYEGMLLRLARIALPSLVTFRDSYSDPTALFVNATEFDRRLLGNLDRSVWDSVATGLTRTITDAVIDNAVLAMPPQYAASSRVIAERLKIRRDHLREAADLYYGELWPVADIHGTDADDNATVVRSSDGSVDVSIRSGSSAPWYHRRFDPAETHEIRLYLHGGNDNAAVTGTTTRSIALRIIGGNGTNTLIDSSTVGGRRNPTRLYDVGTVEGVKYARDSADEKVNEDNAFNHYFNRRPWLRAYGTLIPPVRDRGSAMRPIAGVRTQRGLGVIPHVGIAWYKYGFRSVPYASMVEADAAYSIGSNRFAIGLGADKRFESSDIHLPATAGITQLEVVQFHGFGNDILDLRGHFYDVRQSQWYLRPAIGLSLNPESEISLGPIVRYSSTDSVGNRFISTERPYGFAHFGEAGLELKLRYDTRVVPDTTKPRAVFDITGGAYPAIWDVASAYGVIDGVASAFVTLPVATKPVLAFRAGGKKLFGDFPYFDAAFLGGSHSLRTEERQRYAGDASLYGSTELRVPIAKFPFILPLDVGVLGFADAGRVYLNGESPGGWHTAAGGGFWVGVVNPGTSVNVLFTNRHDRRTVANVGFAF